MNNQDLEERKKNLLKEMGLPADISMLELVEKYKHVVTLLSDKNQMIQTLQNSASAKITDKDRIIQDLQARLAKYEGNALNPDTEGAVQSSNIQRKIVATSNNTSVPPSKNPPGVKHLRTKSLRDKSGKKPGGQLGHRGITYTTPSDSEVKTEKRWYPAGDKNTHSECYEGAVRYVIDIPYGIMPEITKHISMCRKDIDGKILKGEFQRPFPVDS